MPISLSTSWLMPRQESVSAGVGDGAVHMRLHEAGGSRERSGSPPVPTRAVAFNEPNQIRQFTRTACSEMSPRDSESGSAPNRPAA